MEMLEKETAAPTAIGNGGKQNFAPRKSNRSRWHAQEKWASDHPLEVWAHYCLGVGLKRGLIVREACEVCGADDTDGHHEDYQKPLDVRWLCRRHHKAEHRRLRCEATG